MKTLLLLAALAACGGKPAPRPQAPVSGPAPADVFATECKALADRCPGTDVTECEQLLDAAGGEKGFCKSWSGYVACTRTFWSSPDEPIDCAEDTPAHAAAGCAGNECDTEQPAE